MTIGVVLFDLDGTLVDSLQDLTDAVNHMLFRFERRALNPSQVQLLVGKGARNLVQRALNTDSPDEINEGLAAFTAFNELHIADNSRLYPGVRELLQQLADGGIRMAIISNKNEALSRLILKTLAIDTYFDLIAGGDSFEEMKPSPLPLIKVITALSCTPAKAIMIGDSINDILAGNRAGITTIGCAWGYGDAEELRSAQYQATSLTKIISIINSITTH